jgi:hypothetical protein
LQKKLFVWVSQPLALLNIVWKTERSIKNEKTLIQNENCEVFLNEVQCEDEEIEEDPILQSKENRISKNDEKLKKKLRTRVN